MKKPWLQDVRWLFFDMGSTLIDERAVWDRRIRDTLALPGQRARDL